jgi:hypothetical protein
MTKRIFGCMAFLGLLMTGSVSLQAHHSLAGVYDMKNPKEMSGTVASIKFTNPHGSLSIAVKNADGTSTEWVMTLGSATALAQRGVGKTGPNALHTGERFHKVPPREGRQPAGVPPDGDHA